jgi:hypothetical protein
MKKIIAVLIVMVFFAIPAIAQDEGIKAPTAAVDAQAVKKEFIVYTDRFNVNNHYTASGFMGDYGDISIDDNCKITPNNGKTCLKISYTAKGSQGAGWMGIYWQNPANNWGSQMGGFDLTGYNTLEFWARGEKGQETISEFKVGGITGTYPDSDSTSIGPITLSKDWTKYEIDLKGLDLSYISGGFELSASSKDNPEGLIIYLDDIKYAE